MTSSRSVFWVLLSVFFVVFFVLQFQADSAQSIPQSSKTYYERDAGSEPISLSYFKKVYANPVTGKTGAYSAGIQSHWRSMIESQKIRTRGDEEDIEWVEVGPTNVGGRTRAVAIDKNDSLRLITGGVRGGLWISENYGDQWEHVKGITENESITHIEQHPNSPHLWYASTGEYVGSGANFFGGGLLYSQDNGYEWDIQQYEYRFDASYNEYTYQAIDDFPITSAPNSVSREGTPFQYASKIRVHPNSNSIFVATHEWGILKSEDGIQSFVHSLPSNPERYDRQLLPVDTSTSLLLRFEDDLEGESGENPLQASEIDFRDGVFGKGAYLDSFDVLQYASAGVINSQEGTIEFWLQPEWDGDNNQEHLLLEFGEFPYFISLRRIINNIEVLYGRGDGEEWYVTNSNTSHWRAGEWHHIAYTWNSESVELYLDGKSVSAVPVVSLPDINKDFFQFGVPWGDGVGGVIDEFRISSRALTDLEINRDYQFGTMVEAGPMFPTSRPRFSDISIGPNGDLLAYLSDTRSGGSGVYRSTDDGDTWKDITPVDWPEYVERGIIEHAPSNPEIAYLLLLRPGEKLTFYKIDLLNETFENRTQNLPTEEVFPGNYYLVMNVKPDDEDFIVIGGVNLFRSVDAFANPIADPTINYIQNRMHVDNHLVYYNPFNPDEVWAVNDGGIYYTEDIARISGSYDNVRWQDKDNNFNVTQFYSVAQSRDPQDHRVIGGAQDNGYLQVAPADPKEPWRAFGDDFGSDGAFMHLSSDFNYMSFQIGETYRLNRGPNGDADWQYGWIEISPAGAPGRDFIHPWVVDPNDENTMYYPINNKMYRIDEIDKTPINSSYGEENYDLISDGNENGHDRITALAVTTKPAHTLIFAATGEKPIIKRIKNAHTDEFTVEDLSIDNAAVNWTNTRCIAPNPENGDEWLVVMTNFDVPSLYHTSDGGQTYQIVEGNLASIDDIPGPIMEWAEILNFNDEKYYFLATHIGVFMTHLLDGENTVWTHMGTDVIGYAMAMMVQARESDGKIVVGTHGRGFFAGYLTQPSTTNTIDIHTTAFDMEVFPNPVGSEVSVSFFLDRTEKLGIELYDLQGRLLLNIEPTTYLSGKHQVQLNLEKIPAGVFLVGLRSKDQIAIRKLIKG